MSKVYHINHCLLCKVTTGYNLSKNKIPDSYCPPCGSAIMQLTNDIKPNTYTLQNRTLMYFDGVDFEYKAISNLMAVQNHKHFIDDYLLNIKLLKDLENN